MKYSELLVKTRRERGKDIESINADLLIRACFADQLMAGVYTYLPLGLRVLNKIEIIIRDEMNKAGGQELLMPVLTPRENWEKTGRWDALDDLFRFTSYYSKTDLALGPTHEEVVVPLMKKFISSYRDLPKYVYQIQDKFRDEKRAKAGLLRGREFLMKDLYSFHTDETDLDRYYEVMKKAYLNIYKRAGIGDKTYLTFASGGTFSKFSHEFQTESESGEDLIYLCPDCRIAINKEIIDEQKTCPDCGGKNFKMLKAIEVGNIFKLRSKYSEPFGLTYTSDKGEEKIVEMGCYGIGLGRLMGTIVEVSHDERGIIWPLSVAPFAVTLVHLGGDKPYKMAEKVHKELTNAGIEVLWDDRDESVGTKLADCDLIGNPLRIIISEKTLTTDSAELKHRNEEKTEIVKITNLTKEVEKVLANVK